MRKNYAVIFYPDGKIMIEADNEGNPGEVILLNSFVPDGHYPDAFGGAMVKVSGENSNEAIRNAKAILANKLTNFNNRPSSGLLENFAPCALKGWGYKHNKKHQA